MGDYTSAVNQFSPPILSFYTPLRQCWVKRLSMFPICRTTFGRILSVVDNERCDVYLINFRRLAAKYFAIRYILYTFALQKPWIGSF
jgi:hypothetical protein